MRAGPVALLLLVLPLLLLPGATAQVPPPCGPLGVAASTPAAVAPGGVADVTVTVWNNGSRAADVTVAASVPTPGWTIVSENQATASVAASGSTTFAFRVRAQADASQDGRVTFATTGNCPPPGNLPCPQNACTAQGPATSATLALRPEPGFRIPGLDNVDFPVEYLVAGVILVAVAVAIPLAVRRRGGGAALLACPEPLKPVKPGKGASFPLELKNASDQPLRAGLEVGPVPEGWSAFLPLPEVQLAPKEARQLWLMVRAPPDARPGDKADVEVRATDPARPERPVLLRVRAEVMDGPTTGGGPPDEPQP